MTTVNWDRMSGDDIEMFVAAALTKGRAGGCQITPSSGDGGIDVLLPNDDNTWEVVQVKRYSGPLSTKQKTSIRESWDRFLGQELPGYQVSSWTLAMPWNPTREALTWLQDFPPKRSPTKSWMGRTNLDVLAAENPQLVDYYFGNGAERVETLLTTGLQAGRPTAGLTDADLLGAVRQRHEALAKALDEIDPFYSYELLVKVGHVPTDNKAFAMQAQGAATAQFATIDATHYSVLRIIPNHPLAAQLRPIRHTVRFEAEPGTPEHQMLSDFATYGTPFQNVVGEVVEAVGPPGTGRAGRSLFSLTALPNDEFPPLELRAFDSDGTAIAHLPLQQPDTSAGFRGEGFWLTAQDPSSLVTVELRAGGEDNLWRLDLRHGSLTGHPAVEASRIGEFYLALEPGHSLTLAQVGGMELLAPFDLTGGQMDVSIWKWVEVYARLQKHTHDRVVLPDFGEVPLEEFIGLFNTVRALGGEEVEIPWHSADLRFPEAELGPLRELAELNQPFESLEVFDFATSLGGVTVGIRGRLAARLLSCRITIGQPDHDGITTVTLFPAEHDRAELSVVDESLAVGRHFDLSNLDESDVAAIPVTQ